MSGGAARLRAARSRQARGEFVENAANPCARLLIESGEQALEGCELDRELSIRQAQPLLGQQDTRAAAVGRMRATANQCALLQPVECPRHSRSSLVGDAGKLGRRIGHLAAQDAEHLLFHWSQTEPGENFPVEEPI